MKNKMKKNIHQEKVNTVYQNKIIEFIKKGIKNKQYRPRIRRIVKKCKIKKWYDENKEKSEIEKKMLIYILITNELCRKERIYLLELEPLGISQFYSRKSNYTPF